MTDMDEEMACQRHKYAKPKTIENIIRKIVCQKTYSEEGDEFFVDGQGKACVCHTTVSIHYLGKTVEKISVSLEEPDKTCNLFHIMKDE